MFLAKAPAPAPASTMMFGAPSTQAAPDAGPTPAASTAAPNRTMMFGAPGANAAAAGPTPAASARPPASTMMFGVGGAPVAPAAASQAPATAAPNRTMMFGAAGANTAGPTEVAPPAAKPAGTMIFGAAGANLAGAAKPEAPSAAKPAGTMIFGAAGANAAAPHAAEAPAAAKPAGTMIFGAAGANAAAPQKADAPAPTGGANRTMMFGAPAANAAGPAAHAPPAAKPAGTMIFGAAAANATAAPKADAPAPAGGTNRTMMFGAPAANAPASPEAAAPAAKPAGTMIFGAPAAAAAPPAAAPAGSSRLPSGTMIFGAPATAAASPSTEEPTAAQSGKTAIFGLNQIAPGPAAAPKSSPLHFGGPAASPPGPKPKLTESTVRIGPDDLERMMREHEAGKGAHLPLPTISPPTLSPAGMAASEGARGGSTQMFAMSSSPPATGEAGQAGGTNRTQMFAMSDAGPTIAPTQQSAGGTQMFAMSDAGALSPLAASPVSSNAATLPLDAPVAPAAPAPLLEAATIPHHPPVAAEVRARIELPPDDDAGAFEQADPAAVADEAMALRAQVLRRNRIAGIAIALVLMTVALAVSWRVFGKVLLAPKVPVEAMQKQEAALATLRFDDSGSKSAAVTELNGLLTSYPDFVEAHAAMVTALSLQLDDVQQRVRRLEKEAERLNAQVMRLNKDKAPGDWQTRAQAFSDEAKKVIEQQRALADAAQKLDAKAREAYRGLEDAVTRVGDPPTQAKLATIRAQALFHGVSGTEQAIQLTERYRALQPGVTDGWIDLAIPEYAVNARVSNELKAEAAEKLEKLHQQDSTFLRTYVLAARLQLLNHNTDAAQEELEKVLAMRKDHDVALELQEWLRAHSDEH